MGTYLITYTSKKGHVIRIKVRGNNSEEAMASYAQRRVFGGNSIFCNVSTKNIDADTYGCEWGVFRADGIRVMVTKFE